MGGATIIAGINAETFFSQTCKLWLLVLFCLLSFNTLFCFPVPLTAASIVVSVINLTWTLFHLHWFELKNVSKNHKCIIPSPRTQRSSHMFSSLLSFTAWFSVSTLVSIASIVSLITLTWVEVFSGELLTEDGTVENNQIFILPVIMLLLPIPINAIIHTHYQKYSSVFSFAHGVLSAVFATGFINDKSPSKTKKLLRYNQLLWWTSHISAWLVYGIIVYTDYLEDTGFTKLFPVALSCLTFGPMLGAIHWSYSINPRYNKRPRDLNNVDSEEKSKIKQVFVVIWSLFTAITRLLTLALLIYIYKEHWVEVRVFNPALKLALLETLPFLGLIVLANVGLQFALSRRSLFSGLLAIFVPNGYFDKPQCAKSYVVLNFLMNCTLYAALYLVLTFYCWECTKILSLHKLMTAFPAVAVLWILNFMLTVAIWTFTIKPYTKKQLVNPPSSSNNGNTNYAMDDEDDLDNNEVNSVSPNPQRPNQSEDNYNSWTSRDSVNTPL